MKQISLLILIFLTCLFAGCSDDSIDISQEPVPEKGIVVELTTGQLETKTDLYSQASLHHVKSVYAILYYCGESTTTTIDPKTTKVVSSQLLKKENTTWNPSADSNYGPGISQTETFKLQLPEEQIFFVPGKYMILCVGLDDASGETYGLTYDEANKKPAFAQKGATLAEAQAVFAKEPKDKPSAYENDLAGSGEKQDKDVITYGQPDIAHSELFAGWQAFDFTPDRLNVVQVELRRRVAGVLCYFSDIPYKLNIENTPYRVTNVRLSLHTTQNGQISLMRKLSDDGKPVQDDFGQPVEGKEISRTLCEFNLMDFKAQAAAPNTGDPLYQIPTAHLKGRKQLPNTILMGTYVLPIQNEMGKATLTVDLLGYEYDDTSSNDNHIATGKGPGDGVEATVIKSFPAIYEGKGNQKVYDLLPNVIYHIGHKLENDNTEGDYPESLAGTKVTVQEQKNDTTNVNVEFPSVPIVPLMSWLDKDGYKYKTEPEGDGDKFYIFDSMGSDNYINISASILYSDWKLEVITPSGSTNGDEFWIEFWDEKEKKYVTSLEGSGEQRIALRMHDFASVDAWQQNQDTRTITIRLTAKDNAGNEVSEASTDLNIWQYNALIVQMESDDNGYRGFSRFDFGTQRDPVTGEEIPNTAITMGWGYWKSFPITPAWGNGKKNYEYLIKHWHKSFKDCAVQRCGLGAYGIELDIDHYEEGQAFWYLAARDELLPFFAAYHNQEKAHIKKDQFYWTSNEWQNQWRAAAGIYSLKKNKATWDDKRKESLFYARQACYAQ